MKLTRIRTYIFFFTLIENTIALLGKNSLIEDSYNTLQDEIESTTKLDNNKIPQDIQDLLRYNLGLTNEDKFLSGTELLTKYGYPHEEHTVETTDGYLLLLVRMPNDGPAVVLGHGIFGAYEQFITSGVESALAYILFRAGYDVWMINYRGNTFSRRHVKLSPEGRTFWDFSWHEMGIYDFTACVDFVLLKTGQSQVMYIGYSQGTTASYVALSEKPEYNKKIKLLMSLAPIAYLKKSSFIAQALYPFTDDFLFVANALNMEETLARQSILGMTFSTACGTSVTAGLVCSAVFFSVGGYDYAQINYTNYPVQLSHALSGTSKKDLVHYFQNGHSGDFQQFDYGKKGNMEKYSTETPPAYKLSRVSAPAALMYGSNDRLATVTNVDRLSDELPNVVKKYLVPYPNFNHVDFVWAKDVKSLLYNEVLSVLSQYRD